MALPLKSAHVSNVVAAPQTSFVVEPKTEPAGDDVAHSAINDDDFFVLRHDQLARRSANGQKALVTAKSGNDDRQQPKNRQAKFKSDFWQTRNFRCFLRSSKLLIVRPLLVFDTIEEGKAAAFAAQNNLRRLLAAKSGA